MQRALDSLITKSPSRNVGSCKEQKKGTEGVRPFRGYFGPLFSQKLKIAFHHFILIGLLEK